MIYYDPNLNMYLDDGTEAVGWNPSGAQVDIVGYNNLAEYYPELTGAVVPMNRAQAQGVIARSPMNLGSLMKPQTTANVIGFPRAVRPAQQSTPSQVAQALNQAAMTQQAAIAQMGGQIIPSVGGPQGTLVYKTGDNPNQVVKLRRQIAPISQRTLAAGANATVTILAQRPFRIDALILRASVADAVVITDFKIGQEPQFVADGNCPIEAFSADAVNQWLRSNASTPGVSISLSVLNTSAGNVTVGGMFVGESIDG